jgi:hypothetical protein
VFVPSWLFKHSLMFASNVTACTSEAPFRCSTLRLAPGLTHKHLTRPERRVRNKHLGLVGPLISYEENKKIKCGEYTPSLALSLNWSFSHFKTNIVVSLKLSNINFRLMEKYFNELRILVPLSSLFFFLLFFSFLVLF